MTRSNIQYCIFILARVNLRVCFVLHALPIKNKLDIDYQSTDIIHPSVNEKRDRVLHALILYF